MKLGHYILQMEHLLPEPYSRILSPLLMDEVHPTNFEEMFMFIEKEYRDRLMNVREIFRDIDPNPISVSCLTQIYKGHLFDGTPIAIKVGYK